jgi:hypothetical protein
LKLRVARVKAGLPERFEYIPLYQYEFGAQDENHLWLVRRVWNLRAADEKITQRLEAIAENIKNA